jgi:Tfp pilus assembly protein PilF
MNTRSEAYRDRIGHSERFPEAGMRFSAVSLLVLAAAAAPAGRAASSSDVTSAVERAEARLRGGDGEGASSIVEAALVDAPEDARLWRVLGEAYGVRARAAPLLSRYRLAKKCREAFEKAVALAPEDVEARLALFTYDLEAPAIAGGGTARAREQAESIVRLDPARGHAALGALFTREKDVSRAEAEYRAALEADPRSSEARAGLGTLLVEQGRFEEARRTWLALVDDPDVGPIAHFQLGTIARLSGAELDEGIDHLKRYLASPPLPEAPTRADAQWTLGVLYEKAGRRTEAAAAFHDALRLDPDHAEAKKELRRLGQ